MLPKFRRTEFKIQESHFIDKQRRNEFKSFVDTYNFQMGTRRKCSKFSFRMGYITYDMDFRSFLVTPCALTSCHVVIGTQGDDSASGQSDTTGV